MTAILFLIFLSVAFGMLAILTLTEKAPALSRLLRLHDTSPVEIIRDPNELADRHRLQERLAAVAAQFAGRAARDGSRAYGGMRMRLMQGGFRRPSSLPVYLGSRIVLAIVFGVGMLLIPATWSLTDLQLFGGLAGAAGLGYVLPGLFVDASRRRRQALIRNGLPDVVDLMVVCLEAGLSLSAALMRVAAEFAMANPVLASEFKLVVLETQAGKSNAEALRSLIDRTGVADISSFVSMLIQTERFGTNLAETFRVHSEGMRHQRLIAAEEAAQKAPVKMLIPAAVFIFPATLIVTIGPGILQILKAFE